MVPIRFRVVPAGSGRFRMGSIFYIHPIESACAPSTNDL